MARIFIDGFESGDTSMFDIATSQFTASSTYATTGTYSVFVNTGYGSSQHYGTKFITISGSTIYIKFSIRPTYVTGNGAIVQFSNASGIQMCLGIDANRKLTLRRGSWSGTLLGTGTNILPLNVWSLIECKLVISSSVGIGETRVNGLSDILVTGANTQGQSTATITSFDIGSYGDNWDYITSYIDDIVVDDSSWIGNTRIYKLVPNGAGNSTQWTPSTGSNYQCVDEVPTSLTDYVSTNTADQIDLYTASDLPTSISEVKCLQLAANVVRDGNPNISNIQLACRTNSSNYFGPSTPIPYLAPIGVVKLWELNPGAGTTWTSTDINTIEIGFKSIT